MASSSSFALIIHFFLALVASIAEARVAPGEDNSWQGIAKDEAMVEANENLIHGESTSLSSKKNDCHTSSNNQNQKAFVRDFKPRPNLSAYPNYDAKIDGTEKSTFMTDFEPKA